jgi:hypothetical protein
MIVAYVVLLAVGFVLTAILASRRSRQAWTAAMGTALAVFAVIAGFSIGWYLAQIAFAVLALAAWSSRPRRRVA